jgi:hypothetical protein
MEKIIFDSWCKNNNCEHYREWEFSDIDGVSYPCFSCDLIGQSYHVDKIADNCPFSTKNLCLNLANNIY